MSILGLGPVWGTLTIVAAAAFSFVFMHVRKFPKSRALLAAYASIGIAFNGAGGVVSRILIRCGHWVTHTENHVGAVAFGSGIAGVGALVLAFYFIHDLWPKNTAKTRTQIIGWILPILGVAAGGPVAQVITGIHTSAATTAAITHLSLLIQR